jgi:hypothetical protein
MSKLNLIIVLLVYAIGNASAEERKLIGSEILDLLNDKTYQQIRPTTKYRIEQIFQKAGNTHFIVNGDVQQGLWRVESDQYCSSWPPANQWDCYDIFTNGPEIVFLSARGARYVFVTPLP